jgi:hypothetical protein
MKGFQRGSPASHHTFECSSSESSFLSNYLVVFPLIERYIWKIRKPTIGNPMIPQAIALMTIATVEFTFPSWLIKKTTRLMAAIEIEMKTPTRKRTK